MAHSSNAQLPIPVGMVHRAWEVAGIPGEVHIHSIHRICIFVKSNSGLFPERRRLLTRCRFAHRKPPPALCGRTIAELNNSAIVWEHPRFFEARPLRPPQGPIRLVRMVNEADGLCTARTRPRPPTRGVRKDNCRVEQLCNCLGTSEIFEVRTLRPPQGPIRLVLFKRVPFSWVGRVVTSPGGPRRARLGRTTVSALSQQARLARSSLRRPRT